MSWKCFFFFSQHNLIPKTKGKWEKFPKECGWGRDESTETKVGLLDYLFTNRVVTGKFFIKLLTAALLSTSCCCTRCSSSIVLPSVVWEAGIQWQFRQHAGAGLMRWGGLPVSRLCSFWRIIWLSLPVFLFWSNLGRLNSVALVLSHCDFVTRADVFHCGTASWVRSRLRATVEDAAMS